MSVTCEVSQLPMSALKLAFTNRLDMSVMSDVSQSPMSSVKVGVPGPELQVTMEQHWTPLASFVRQLS